MRIAFVNTRSDAVGGSQVHVRDMADALLRRGHDVKVFVGGNGPATEQLTQRGVPWATVRHLIHSIHPVHDALALAEMCQALRDFSPHLVSTHTSKAGVIGRAAARRLDIPSLFTAHGWNFADGIERNRGFRLAMEKVCSRWSARVITVSESDRQLALRHQVVQPERLITIHNGMPQIPPTLRANPAATPARIVMVARFEAQKDHRTLLHALARLKHLPWELELIGGGPLMDGVRDLSQQLGISHRIEFAGPRNDVAERLSQAQIFALISNWEGLPRSMIEAMRAGLPIVASDVGGAREMVLPGRTGYLVERGDVNAVKAALEDLICRPRMRVQFGHAAVEHFYSDFTFHAMFQKTLAVYQEVLEEARPRPRAARRTSEPKIVHVVESYGAGTAEVIGQLTGGMPQYQHVVICGRRPESTTVEPPVSSSNTSIVPWRGVCREISPLADLAALVDLLGTLRRLEDIGVLHAHSAKGGFLGRLAARFMRLHNSTVYTTHGTPIMRRDVNSRRRELFRVLEWIGSRLAGTVVACSPSEHAVLTAAGIAATFIANGVDAPIQPIPHFSGVLRVGTAARATAAKDPAFFRQIANAMESDAQIHFVWIGGGELSGELVAPNITATGWLGKQAMRDECVKLGVYISTSIWEGLSLGVLHAMGMGKPLVLRRCPGNVDVVEHGENGFLFDTVQEAVGFLRMLMNDPVLRQKMGGRSREIFLRRFTADRMIQQYGQLYETLLGKRAVSTAIPRRSGSNSPSRLSRSSSDIHTIVPRIAGNKVSNALDPART